MMTEYHQTDYHRDMVARYYKRLLDWRGMEALMRHMERLKQIVWTQNGLKQVERRIQ